MPKALHMLERDHESCLVNDRIRYSCDEYDFMPGEAKNAVFPSRAQTAAGVEAFTLHKALPHLVNRAWR